MLTSSRRLTNNGKYKSILTKFRLSIAAFLFKVLQNQNLTIKKNSDRNS